ncbi:bifunctional diaminohydroxyphosphoribosylaminopyrimidine deaminase/5-amino-6-(5-phosphoribosylamino)uracil reductase RibD [Desulfopila sp. IMCC35008]|uniref:bifunctional diaminohydroxyphosphoribosylaminopyrimidine deaminase/5-amino-6-(5-phosphoribosylamino)uracil reductase RibD n=1 Tax=Desulfopila sp. IMCC35008 TaxID=2653858 RepID=UPI001F10DA61|nr:bifunctional diaminohydroxyphosphoribosylaminopyrimidine deaminase/5-amino-6-(5-phosphoribosylamino)uracil reductase RibD [Desulfopila sp. IMCC35008]
MRNEFDSHFMKIALNQARKGEGRTSPNPCVGAVLVKGHEIVGRGYHKKAGTPHAEIHALADAGSQAQGATMYVTLEPCNHTGKTPPCSHAVAKAGVSRVVVGMRDPNPLVDGSGIDYLQEHGIEVHSGVLEAQCRTINLPFLKHITTGLPYLIMKAGISLDGKLNYESGTSGWITGTESGKYVHRLRNRYDSIMVGCNTVLIDNPSLTTRLAKGQGRDPVRVILDRELRIPLNAKVFSATSGAYCWIFCSKDADENKIDQLQRKGVKVSRISHLSETELDLPEMLKLIGKAGICSVLIEGGAALHGSFMRQKLFDYAYLFQAPLFAGEEGLSLISGYSARGKAEASFLKDAQYKKLGKDIVIHGALSYP